MYLQHKGRIYKVGAKLIVIPKNAVDKIIEWNQGPKREDIIYDRKICHSLLLSLVCKDQLSAGKIDDEVIKFITCNYFTLISRCYYCSFVNWNVFYYQHVSLFVVTSPMQKNASLPFTNIRMNCVVLWEAPSKQNEPRTKAKSKRLIILFF